MIFSEGLIVNGTCFSNCVATKIELNSICRLCVQSIQEEKICPIFNNEVYDDKISLSERIKYCSSVEVSEGDELPAYICNSCLLKLNQSFVFRNQCVLSDIILKHIKNDNFNLNEVSELLKVDIQNQIIKLESNNDETKNIFHTLEAKENLVKKEISTDEYDTSKNGRHKRSICKSKENSSERVAPNVVNNLNRSENAEPESEKSLEEQKNKSKRKNNKPRILKVKKEANLGKNKIEAGNNNEQKTEVESFTIEPDIFNFHELIEKEESSKNVLEKQERNFKLKASGVKKRKPRKIGEAKEKPSSYTCEYCQKVYPSEGGWRYHIHTVHNANYQPFICDLCGQSFKVKKNLEGHKNSVHYHLKLHLCDICGRGFASKYALKVHKIWHNDEKNFTCDICGTKFRTRGKMNTHRSIHGGPKKFMCHICSRDFRWKKDFEIHMRTHTGEKPFKCSHCGKAFASLTNMKKHERNHVDKANVKKTTEGVEPVVAEVDNRVYKNELLDFGYGSEDVRNPEVSQIFS